MRKMKMFFWTAMIMFGLTVTFAESVDKVTPVHVEIDVNETHCLAQNIYFEAGNQSLDGMAAVADVTLNRVKSSRFPSTICDVVKQGLKDQYGGMRRNLCQFSWYCDGKSDNISRKIVLTKEWWNSKKIAEDILLEFHGMKEGNWMGITSESTHYHANYVVPNWINDIGMKRKIQIGSHIFYKFR
jgi:spore germination cell wall hydrolase CwlJ-like protein